MKRYIIGLIHSLVLTSPAVQHSTTVTRIVLFIRKAISTLISVAELDNLEDAPITILLMAMQCLFYEVLLHLFKIL